MIGALIFIKGCMWCFKGDGSEKEEKVKKNKVSALNIGAKKEAFSDTVAIQVQLKEKLASARDESSRIASKKGEHPGKLKKGEKRPSFSQRQRYSPMKGAELPGAVTEGV